MADPRSLRLTDGIGAVYAPFIHVDLTSADEGKAVSMSGNAGVVLCASNAVVVGKLFRVEDTSTCTVQIYGLAEVACSGTVAVGDIVNGGATAGTVKADNADYTAGPVVVSKPSAAVALIKL